MLWDAVRIGPARDMKAIRILALDAREPVGAVAAKQQYVRIILA
jgi:hypothetical protein